MTKVSAALRRARLQAGISQATLARQLGISPGYLCDVELGRRTLPQSYCRKLPNEVRLSVVAAAVATLERQIDEWKDLLA